MRAWPLCLGNGKRRGRLSQTDISSPTGRMAKNWRNSVLADGDDWPTIVSELVVVDGHPTSKAAINQEVFLHQLEQQQNGSKNWKSATAPHYTKKHEQQPHSRSSRSSPGDDNSTGPRPTIKSRSLDRLHSRRRRQQQQSGMKQSLTLPDMPAEDELLRRFEAVLKMMDLPPDKARLLRSYDASKKWELVCDQEKWESNDRRYQGTPLEYIEKLQTFLADNSKNTNKKRQKKLLGDETSTKILKHLEISLRTNSIDWTKEYLSDENNGLRVLVDYLRLMQDAGGLQQPSNTVDPTTASTSQAHSNGSHHGTYEISNGFSDTLSSGTSRLFDRKGSLPSSSRKTGVVPGKNNQGLPEDDIHQCILCLRAIMNNKFGFNKVFVDGEAIYSIVRSLLHASLRTKALVLELLAAVCLVKGGHEVITPAFDRFALEYHERKRFETLMNIFREPVEFNVNFMVACMQFINIVVHSVDDMNYRIFLQYEFAQLGLDDYLQLLSSHESDLLHVQVEAYIENTFDVGQLFEESEQKAVLAKDNEDLTAELSRVNEKLQEVEADYMCRVSKLDGRLNELLHERDQLIAMQRKADNEVTTLRRELSAKEQTTKNQQAQLESKIQELEVMQHSMKEGLHRMTSTTGIAPSPTTAQSTVSTATSPTVTPAAPLATPPPPPPPPPPLSAPPPPPPIAGLASGAPAPPPPPAGGFLAGGPNAGGDMMTIKRRIQTRHKLPMFNWTALKPNQVKDTVFHNMDDDKIIERIDFSVLENNFKLGAAAANRSPEHGAARGAAAEQHRPTGPQPTILDVKRTQNVAITRRKLAVDTNEVKMAVHKLDLAVLGLDKVDMLMRCLPTAEETQAFKLYEQEGKPVEALTLEERFVLQLCKIERLQHKLHIMSFMGNFSESAELIEPQFTALTAASKCVREARKFHGVLEVVLAYGNYLNSQKRGGVFGFKLQSLDALPTLRSPFNKSLSLMHVIVDSVRQCYPELLNFHEELKFINKASGISMEALVTDMAELDKGYGLAKTERQMKTADGNCPPALNNFMQQAEPRIQQLQDNWQLAKQAFRACVEFYGESGNTSVPNGFFTILVNFVRNWKQALSENIEREKAEQAPVDSADHERALVEEKRRESLLEHKRARNGNGNAQVDDLVTAVNAELAGVLGVTQSSNGNNRRSGPPVAAKNSRSKSRDMRWAKLGADELHEEGALDDLMQTMRDAMAFDPSSSPAGGAAGQRRQRTTSSSQQQQHQHTDSDRNRVVVKSRH